MLTVKVEQMQSTRSYRPVANQFIIETNEGTYFQSYRSIIALKRRDGSVVLDQTYWDYSRTTGKYRNEFLGENTNETRWKIAQGIYTLADLN